jgi:hypothetical protein
MRTQHMQGISLGLATFLVAAAVYAPGAAAQESPLAGPKVDQQASATVLTLITRDFDGAVEELTKRPELAAAELLPLTGEQRAAVEKIATDRAKLAAAALRDNYDLILAFVNARQSQDVKAMREMMPKCRTAVKELMQPVLLEQVATAVGAVHAPQLRGLVKQYVEFTAQREAQAQGRGKPQRTQSEDAQAMEDGESMKGMVGGNTAETPQAAKPVERYSVPMRGEMMLCLREVGYSLKGLVDDQRDKVEDLLKTVNATPEQESKIRAILQDAGGPRITKEPTQRREILRRISAVLSPEQRKLLIEKMRE